MIVINKLIFAATHSRNWKNPFWATRYTIVAMAFALIKMRGGDATPSMKKQYCRLETSLTRRYAPDHKVVILPSILWGFHGGEDDDGVDGVNDYGKNALLKPFSFQMFSVYMHIGTMRA